MQPLQAIILKCSDMQSSQGYNDFLDNNLNLYAVIETSRDGIIKMLMTEGKDREELFSEIDTHFITQTINQIIVFAHEKCDGLPPELIGSEHETFVRHAVSVLRAKYPKKDVSAYLIKDNQDQFTANQII